jgi:hypothetical protein
LIVTERGGRQIKMSTSSGSARQAHHTYHDARRHLDRLYAIDATFSFVSGIVALVTPHGIWTSLVGAKSYNHDVHEILRYVAESWCQLAPPCGLIVFDWTKNVFMTSMFYRFLSH